MAEHSGFFDAHASTDADGNVVYDRVYLAEQFARYFANFIGNGVFAGKSSELMVQQKESADMSVRVLPGQGFINGYFYENTDELSLAIDNADGVLNRIDLIVLRWDKYERTIRIAVEKGTPASTPSVPLLKRNDDYFELELAKVFIKAGATNITQVDITDTRLDSEVCGFVVSTIEQIDTAEFNAQLNAWFEEFKLYSYEEVEDLVDQLKTLIESAGDLGSIIVDVQDLQALSIESPDYPGCYYRLVNGETEWLNPPNEIGIEYRLTERWQGRIVYQKLLYVASLPSASQMFVSTLSNFDEIISATGRAYNNDAIDYTFPVHRASGAAPAAAFLRFHKTGGQVGIFTTEDMSNYQAEIMIKYVKA